MAYYIAVRSGVGYAVLPESFNVRSNAARFARRRGWEGYFIVTEEQRLTIEANQYLDNGSKEMSASITSASGDLFQTSASSPVEAMPDVAWMKEEGMPWDKNKRKAKKK